MIAIIVDNHAHRLLKSGVVESAKMHDIATKEEDGRCLLHTTISSNWQILSPEKDLNMYSADFDYAIRKPLELLHQLFPADRKPLPSVETQETVIPPADEVRK